MHDFKIDETEQKYLEILHQKAFALLKPSKKRGFDQSLAIKNTI
jgi:hypothetical protein